MQQLIDRLATSESPVVDVVFDAETEAKLAGINPATAAAIRSIARQLAAANTAHTRGYVAGYLDGVRKRLNVPKVEAVSAVADNVPRTIDPTIAERFLDEAYSAMDEWSTKVTTPERSYVEAGHDVLAALDGAMDALQAARRKMVEEIGQDAPAAERVEPVAHGLAEYTQGAVESYTCRCGHVSATEAEHDEHYAAAVRDGLGAAEVTA